MKLFFFLILSFSLSSFTAMPEPKYDSPSLAADLDYVVTKIKNVHNAPFTYQTEAAFNQQVENIRSQLKDSMSAQDFCTLLQPLFASLGDEHARISSPNSFTSSPSFLTAFMAGLQYETSGNLAVLTVPHFTVNNLYPLERWKREIDSVFTKIQQDRIENLIIDVSRNQGGNSKVGDLLIDYFYAQPYKRYSFTWKKSDEFLEIMKSYNWTDSAYAALKNGEYKVYPSNTTYPQENPHRFNGKVWLAVGKNTFSSAMIFATVVKDNHLARLIGETPSHGHPNHFGEMACFKTPHTRLNFCFGVKQFVRPSGNVTDNVLEPDIPVDLSKIQSPADWLPYLK